MCGCADRGLCECGPLCRCGARLLCPGVQHGGGCRSGAEQEPRGRGPHLGTECRTARTERWRRRTVTKRRWSAGRSTATMCGMWLRLAKGRLELGRLPRESAGSSPYPPRRGNHLFRRRETTMSSNKISGEFVAAGKICLRVHSLCRLVVKTLPMTSAWTLATSEQTSCCTGRCPPGHPGLNPRTLVLNAKPRRAAPQSPLFWGAFLTHACDTHA